jgi:hypothetical protein
MSQNTTVKATEAKPSSEKRGRVVGHPRKLAGGRSSLSRRERGALGLSLKRKMHWTGLEAACFVNCSDVHNASWESQRDCPFPVLPILWKPQCCKKHNGEGEPEPPSAVASLFLF